VFAEDVGVIWGQLRATRHAPPGAATNDDLRRRAYVSALEQAEQLFHAASVVGPAARPLPLFYGLSQAGRAIAAASGRLAGDRWQLRSHGIGCADLDGELSDVKLNIQGKPGGAGSFIRLSEVLDSPLWSDCAVTLGPLWDTLPMNFTSPIGPDTHQRRTSLELAGPELFQTQHPLLTATVYQIPVWVAMSVTPREALMDYFASFPGAAAHESYSTVRGDPGRAPDFGRHVDQGWGFLSVNWSVKGGTPATVDERQVFMDAITLPYLGQRWLFPDISGANKPIHPLMAWWAVLFALSMLARYQPAEWLSHVDVDASACAVSLERLLTSALATVPALVIETIQNLD